MLKLKILFLSLYLILITSCSKEPLKESIIKEKKHIFLIVISLSLFSSPLLLRPFLVFLIYSGFVNLNLKFNSY